MRARGRIRSSRPRRRTGRCSGCGRRGQHCTQQQRVSRALLKLQFLGEQGKNIRLVIQDMHLLQENTPGNKKLHMMSDAFIANMVQTVCKSAIDIIDKCMALGADIHALNVMKPAFTKGLLRWFLLIVESHVAQNEKVEQYAKAMALADEREETARRLSEKQATRGTRITALMTQVTALESIILDLREEGQKLENRLTTCEAKSLSAVEEIRAELTATRSKYEGCAKELAQRDLDCANYRNQFKARDDEFKALRGRYDTELKIRDEEIKRLRAQHDSQMKARNEEVKKLRAQIDSMTVEVARMKAAPRIRIMPRPPSVVIQTAPNSVSHRAKTEQQEPRGEEGEREEKEESEDDVEMADTVNVATSRRSVSR
ncbi:hypothetical protein BV20DRAFT_125710 [Pilatotrama ljubarskyi]|nr:hypothetical protein BV20DRAFT_125710 [Pilatotrama ljubarskyi]